MKNGILALLLVSLVILVSGCTMPWDSEEEPVTPGAGTKGVIIQGFTPDIDYIVGDGEQEINLKLTARNVGSETAKNVRVRGQRLSWPGFLTGEETCSEELEPPNPAINKEGQICNVNWVNIQIPEVKKDQTYIATAILNYDYTTTATSNTYVIKNWKLQAMKEAGEPIPRTELTVNSDSPIKLEFKLSEDPLIAKEDGIRTVEGTLMISKVGTGNLEYDKTSRRYTIKEIMLSESDMPGIEIVEDTCTGKVNMRGDREGECNFKIRITGSELPSDIVKIPLEAVAEYTFVVGKDLSLTVHPKLE